MGRRLRFAILVAATVIGRTSPAHAGGLDVAGLRTEYLVDPPALDTGTPRFSWVLRARDSRERGHRQTAYRILVASRLENLRTNQGDLWDSGKVASDATIHVEYGGPALVSRQRCFWKVQIWDKSANPSRWSAPASWAMGLLQRTDWDARFIGGGGESHFPLLRREFTVAGRVKRAVAYVSARGLYELRINGARVGDHVLAPEWTDYRKRIQYQAYDVTAMIGKGANVAGAMLGDGWYSARIPTGKTYGPVPRFLGQIEIELVDGRRQAVVSDDSWRFTDEGPVRSSGIYQGETIDATRNLPGWDATGFDDGAWRPVIVEKDLGPAVLSAQPNEPIRIVRDLAAVAMTEPEPGVYVFDLGQNMTGWARARLRGPRGTIITLRHAEAVDTRGMVDMRSLAEAKPIETYTLAGKGVEVFEPRFTYHGFRYVEVTGLPARPGRAAVVGRSVRSDAPEVGTFESSDPMVNRIFSNVLWTQRNNLTAMLTDCPQRFERLGWLGDAQSFAQTMIFNTDLAALLSKWIRDIRDDQHPDGLYPDWAPSAAEMNPRYAQTYYGAPAWSDGGVVLPWRMYQNYADRRLLAEHYPSAKRFIDGLAAANPNFLRKNLRGKDWGDWMSSRPMDKDAFATAWLAHSADLVGKMAAVLGKTGDAETYGKLFSEVRRTFNQNYVDGEGRVRGDNQSAYALALHFDLLPEAMRPRAVKHLRAAIEREAGHVTTGTHTTSRLLVELSRWRASDQAYQMLLNPTPPSWIHMINQGATTIWEHWQSWSREGGFNPGAKANLSLDHAALGSVGEWLWRGIVGINGDDEQPGFKHILIRPQPGGSLTWAKGRYESIRGPIGSEWRIANGNTTVTVTVPPGTTATVHVPARVADTVRESGKAFAAQPGVKFVRMVDGAAVLNVDSGRYTFSAPR